MTLTQEKSYDKRGRYMSTKFNKNPHWVCSCGISNHKSREFCLGCSKERYNTNCLRC